MDRKTGKDEWKGSVSTVKDFEKLKERKIIVIYFFVLEMPDV